MNDLLLNALKMKAYNEWDVYVRAKLRIFTNRIVANPKGNLAKSLLSAKEEWPSYDAWQKLKILEIVLHESAYAFDIPSPSLYAGEEWEKFFRKKYRDSNFKDLDHSNTVYCYERWESGPGEIAFYDTETIRATNFFSLIGDLAHEIGHAVHTIKGREFKKKIMATLNSDGPWQIVRDDYIDDPLFTMFCLDSLSDFNSKRDEKNNVIDSKDYEGYWNLLDEKLANTFEGDLIFALRNALYLVEASGSDLRLANIVLDATKNTVKRILDHLERDGLAIDLTLAQNILDIKPCEKPEDLAGYSYENKVDAFLIPLIPIWYDYLGKREGPSLIVCEPDMNVVPELLALLRVARELDIRLQKT